MEEKAQNSIEENKQILLQIIEMGSVKGVPEMVDLIQNGYIIRADYDVQIGPQEGNIIGYDDIDPHGEAEYFQKEEDKYDEINATIVDSHSFYTLNWRKFIHVLRNEELKRLVAAKLDYQGEFSKNKLGIGKLIVSLFLDQSQYTDKSEVFEISEILSFSQIKEKLREVYDKLEGKI